MSTSSSRNHYNIDTKDDVKKLIVRAILDFAKSQGLSPPEKDEIKIIGHSNFSLSSASMTTRTSCDELKKGKNLITAIALPQGISHKKSHAIYMTALAICICK